MPTADEQKSLRLARLDSYRTLMISGADRIEFLQGQLTQDVAALAAAGSGLAGWASAKGRLLAFGQLLAVGDEFWWPLPADIADGVARRLGLFKLRAEVQIRTSDTPVAGLLGLAGETRLTLGSETLPLETRPFTLADGSVIAATPGDPDRAWLIGPSADHTALYEVAESEWTLAAIRAGIPTIVAATQEQFVPQMLNLDELDAISFTKGCYVGQEIVARTQNLGRIKRRMYRFSAAAATGLAPGDTIYGQGNATGKVAMAARTGDSIELLAVVAIEQAEGDWFADEPRTQPLTVTARSNSSSTT